MTWFALLSIVVVVVGGVLVGDGVVVVVDVVAEWQPNCGHD